MMAYFTALIMMTMVIATCLTSVQGECLKGDDCSSAAITCKLAGTVYCCGGAGSTVNASAVNGQLKFCTCESTPGITSSSCSEVNSASQLSGTFFTTAVAITVWSVLQA